MTYEEGHRCSGHRGGFDDGAVGLRRERLEQRRLEEGADQLPGEDREKDGSPQACRLHRHVEAGERGRQGPLPAGHRGSRQDRCQLGQPGLHQPVLVGQLHSPTAAGDYSWTSQGDKEKMSSSLLASQDATKDFKYTDGEITYSSIAVGTTTTVHLKKQ